MAKINKVIDQIYNGAPVPKKVRDQLIQREKLQGHLSQNDPVIDSPADYKSHFDGSADISTRIPFARMWTAVSFRREDSETGEFIPHEDREIVLYQVGNDLVTNYDTNENESFVSPTNQLSNNKLMRPAAGIKSITSSGYGQGGVEGFVREITVTFKVYNYTDYDTIFSRYFLTPGSHIFVDFGWGTSNKLYNPKCFFSRDKECGDEWAVESKDQESILYHTARLMSESNGNMVIENGLTTKFDSSLNVDGSYNCSMTFTSMNASLIEQSQSSDDPQEENLSKKLKFNIHQKLLLTIAEILDINIDSKLKDHPLLNKDPNDEFSSIMQRMMALTISADSYLDIDNYYSDHEGTNVKDFINPGQSILDFCLDNGVSAQQLVVYNPDIFTAQCATVAQTTVQFGCINTNYTPQQLYESSNISGGSHWKNRDGTDKPSTELLIVDPKWLESGKEPDIIFKIPKINNKSYEYGIYWQVFDPILGGGNKTVDDISSEDLGVDDNTFSTMKENEIIAAYVKSKVPSINDKMYVSFKFFEEFLNENFATIGEGNKLLTKFDFTMPELDNEGNSTGNRIPKTINYNEDLFLDLGYVSRHREVAFLYPTRDWYGKKSDGGVSIYDCFISVNLLNHAFDNYNSINDALSFVFKKIFTETHGIVCLDYSPADNINSISLSDMCHDIPSQTHNVESDPYMFSLNSPNTIVNTAQLRLSMDNNDLKNLITIQNSTGKHRFLPLTESDMKHSLLKGLNVLDKNFYYTWYPLKETTTEEKKYQTQSDNFNSAGKVKKYEYEDYQKKAMIKELSKAFNFKLSDREQRSVISMESSGGKKSLSKTVYESVNISNILNTTHIKAQEAETIDTSEESKKYRTNLFKKLLSPLKKGKNKNLWKNGVFVLDSIENYFLHKIKKSIKMSQRNMVILPYTVEFSIYGIHGLQPGHEIMVDFLPSLYLDRCKFLIKNVNHDISNTWKTNITTMMVYKSNADLNIPITNVKKLLLSPQTLFELGYGTKQIERIYDGSVEWFRIKPSPWDNSLSKELILENFKQYTTEEPPKWIPDFNKYSQYEDYSSSYDIVYMDEGIPDGYSEAYKIIGCMDPEAENYFCAHRDNSALIGSAAAKFCQPARFCPTASDGGEYDCPKQVRAEWRYTCGPNNDRTCTTGYLVEHIHDLCAGCNDPNALTISKAYESGMYRPDLAIGGGTTQTYKHAAKFYIPTDICEGSSCVSAACDGLYPEIMTGLTAGICTEQWWKIALVAPLGNLYPYLQQNGDDPCGSEEDYWAGDCTYSSHWVLGPHWFGRGEGNECNSPTQCPQDDGGVGPCTSKYKIDGSGNFHHTGDESPGGIPWGSTNDVCYTWPHYLPGRPWAMSCKSTVSGVEILSDSSSDVIKTVENTCCTMASNDVCKIFEKIYVGTNDDGEDIQEIRDVTPYYCNSCYNSCDGYGSAWTNCSVKECVDNGFIPSLYNQNSEYMGESNYPYDATSTDTFKSGPKGNICVAYNNTSLVRGVNCYANPQCCTNYCDQPEPDWWQKWAGKKDISPAADQRDWPPKYICDSDYNMDGYYFDAEDMV